MLKTLHIDKSSPLIDDVKPGDQLVSINGTFIRDQLDYQFLSSDEELEIVFSREGEQFTIELEKDFDDPLGLTLPEIYQTQYNSIEAAFTTPAIKTRVRERLLAGQQQLTGSPPA